MKNKFLSKPGYFSLIGPGDKPFRLFWLCCPPEDSIGYIPVRSRDEMPPVLRALPYICTTPGLNQTVFDILEATIMAGNKKAGRSGMTL